MSRVEASHYGEFVCRATNNMGAARTIVNLVRKGKPESPTELESLDTGSNSIMMSWMENFNGGMNNTMYKIQYRQLGGAISQAKEIMCQSKVSNTNKVFIFLFICIV